MGSRLLNFDIAKAICIILVAIGHYVPSGMPVWYQNLHDWIYLFHMPLFMFASGYIYIHYKHDESYGTFIWKKIKRLMFPYFSTSAIVITIKLLTQKGMYVENPVTYTSYLKMFYLPEAGYFLWFIWALFLMFCIVPLFENRMARSILFALAVLWRYCYSFNITELFCIKQAAGMLIWFMLGVMCVDWKDGYKVLVENKTICRVIMVFLCVAFVTCSVAVFCYNPTEEFTSILKVFMPWLGIGCIMSVSTCLALFAEKKFMYPLLAVGSSSYIIYLFHTTFMGFAKSFVHKIPIMNGCDDMMFTLGVVIVVSAGVVCPVILHKYVLNRWKITKIMFGLK